MRAISLVLARIFPGLCVHLGSLIRIAHCVKSHADADAVLYNPHSRLCDGPVLSLLSPSLCDHIHGDARARRTTKRPLQLAPSTARSVECDKSRRKLLARHCEQRGYLSGNMLWQCHIVQRGRHLAPRHAAGPVLAAAAADGKRAVVGAAMVNAPLVKITSDSTLFSKLLGFTQYAGSGLNLQNMLDRAGKTTTEQINPEPWTAQAQSKQSRCTALEHRTHVRRRRCCR